MLHIVARECGTINYTTWVGGLHNKWAARNMIMFQYKRLHEGSHTMKGDVKKQSLKVTIRVTIHDLIVRICLRGASRQLLRLKSLNIYCQTNINDHILGGNGSI